MSAKKCVLIIFVFIVTAGLFTSKGLAAEELDLKLRLKAGQKYGMRVVRENNISRTMMEQEYELKHTKTLEMDFEVKEADAGGITLITATYRTLKIKTIGPGQQVLYDSTLADNPMARIYTAMTGEGFTIRLTQEGKLAGLDKTDEMFSRMAEKVVEAEDELIRNTEAGTCERDTGKPESKEMASKEETAKLRIDKLNDKYGGRGGRIEAVKEKIKRYPFFAEEQLRAIVSGVIMPFPGRRVEAGDSWRHKESMGKELSVEVDNIYTLKGHKEGAVMVDINSKFILDNEPAGTKKVSNGQMDMRLTGTGACEGTIELDGLTGWVIRKKAKMGFSGEMSQQGMKAPMSMESIVTVERIPLTCVK